MNRERTERSTRTFDPPVADDGSAGDNETCSRPPTDLRGSPAVRASHKRVPNGSLIRWEEPEQRNERYGACDGAAAPFMDRNGIPCWPLDTVSRRGARLKGGTSGCCLSAFPHKTAGARGNQHHSGEEGAMVDTATKEEYTYQVDKFTRRRARRWGIFS